MDTNIDTFKKYFPELYKEFSLKGFQQDVIENVLNRNNTLCIMPTGGGKSIIYWLSGLALKGITIVISPLIALIDEQAEKIREQGYETLVFHSGIPANKQIDLLIKFGNGDLNPHFLFVSPERISTDGFFEYCVSKRKGDVKLLVIDEVHCVSQWGESFRPFYKRVPDFLNDIYGLDSWGPTLLALTATLNSKEVVDICDEFKIENRNILRDDLLIRSEISLKVIKFTDENQKEDKLWDLLDIHRNEKALVYLYRKYHQRGVEDLTESAIKKGFKATSFHGDMTAIERHDIIEDFKRNKIDVIFATNAFGMGIDIPDIRVVIHFMIPESVEQYYQEIGRAARDKAAANAYILYSNKNVQVRKTHFIDKSFPSIADIESCFTKITSNQIGTKTLQYFEDEEIQKCLSYFLDTGLIKIKCKGFSNLKMLSDIRDDHIKKAFNATKTKGTITTSKATGLPVNQIVSDIYRAVQNEDVRLIKPFDKCLIIDSVVDIISDNKKREITEFINERKEYKHKLLDYFVYLLDEGISSEELHQEIGSYLGVPKHLLKRIYATRKGDKVRSKSEVIIANILHSSNIEYQYEKKVFYTNKNWIEPDFTIKMPDNREIYWEHLGMIGTEDYDRRWKEKMEIYKTYFPNSLVKTYEGATISDSAQSLLRKLKLI